MTTTEQVHTGNGAAATPKAWVGQAMRRKEDPRLITGRAIYVDDIVLPGTLYAAIVRSPEAHARITSIDTSAAKERDGVTAVFTGDDLDLAAPLPMAWVPPGVEIANPEHWPLSKGEVNHVGEAVAVVLGPDRYAVVDAAEDVIVEYDPLPPVVDPEAALEEGAPLVHEQLGTNKTHEWSLGGGDVEAGLRDAEVVIERRIVNHRTHGAPIEPRGVVAEYRAGNLTLWTATQIVPGIEPRVVVLGSHADEIREAVDFHGARAVVCEDWADGQSASLAAGLDAVGEVDRAVVVLGDQPSITPEVVALVLEAASDGRPARATFGGAPGHPVVIPAALFDAVRALRGDRGARDVLARAGVREVEADDLCSGVDIDTRADLEAVT